VVRVAKALTGAEPSTTWGNPCWKVQGKAFAWQRPLTKKDRADLGEAAPEGLVIAVRVEDLGEKEAILATPGPWFTTPHFDGYPAGRVDLDEATPEQVHELVLDAWRAMAPADQRASGRFED